MPDIKVGEHIDRDCKSDPAQRKRKVLYNAEVFHRKTSQSLNNYNKLFFIFLSDFHK